MCGPIGKCKIKCYRYGFFSEKELHQLPYTIDFLKNKNKIYFFVFKKELWKHYCPELYKRGIWLGGWREERWGSKLGNLHLFYITCSCCRGGVCVYLFLSSTPQGYQFSAAKLFFFLIILNTFLLANSSCYYFVMFFKFCAKMERQGVMREQLRILRPLAKNQLSEKKTRQESKETRRQRVNSSQAGDDPASPSSTRKAFTKLSY